MNKNRKEHNNQENQSIITEFSPAVCGSVVSVDNQIVKSDWSSELTSGEQKRIMTIEETAQYLRKSLSWVYKNSATLGGRKLGGSLFFPAKEDLYERIFCQRKGVEVRLHPQGDQAHGKLVQNENRGQPIRGRKKKGDKQSETGAGDANRHNLFGPGQSAA